VQVCALTFKDARTGGRKDIKIISGNEVTTSIGI
jgi:hypothetical protein